MLPDREKFQRLLITFQKSTYEDNFIKDEFLFSSGKRVKFDQYIHKYILMDIDLP